MANPEIVIEDLRTNEECAADKYVNGGQRFTSFEQLEAYGVSIDRSKGWDAAPAGEFVWACTGFRIRPGIAAIGVVLYDQFGNKFSDVARVAHTWPGCDRQLEGEILLPDYSYNRDKKIIDGWTNQDGEVWFAIGENYMPPSGSQFRQWVMLPTGPGEKPDYADAVTGSGMWGGTNHTCVSPIFSLIKKTGDTPGPGPGPDPDPGPNPPPMQGDLYVAVVVDGVIKGTIDIDDGDSVQVYLVSKLGDFQL